MYEGQMNLLYSKLRVKCEYTLIEYSTYTEDIDSGTYYTKKERDVQYQQYYTNYSAICETIDTFVNSCNNNINNTISFIQSLDNTFYSFYNNEYKADNNNIINSINNYLSRVSGSNVRNINTLSSDLKHTEPARSYYKSKIKGIKSEEIRTLNFYCYCLIYYGMKCNSGSDGRKITQTIQQTKIYKSNSWFFKSIYKEEFLALSNNSDIINMSNLTYWNYTQKRKSEQTRNSIANREHSTSAVVGKILGIISIPLCCVGLGLILGIVSGTISIINICSNIENQNDAIYGLVTSIIGIILSAFVLCCYIFGFGETIGWLF